MPVMDLPLGSYGRPRVGLPQTRAINVYAEPSKEGPTSVARIPRPGLTSQYTIGDGPILRQLQIPGMFSSDCFSISGGELYRSQALLGAVPYGLQPRMAASLTQLAIVSGGALYVYDGATLTLVQYFDDGSSRLPPFSSVAVLYNIFVYTVAGSNAFYTSNVGDATTIPALNQNNAETSPDPLVEVQVLAEELYFFGTKTTEIWDFNGGADPAKPFSLSQGRTYPRGTAAQGSVAFTDNALFWVGDNYTIYRTSAAPVRVSTPYIEDLLREAGTGLDEMTSFNVAVEGHDFYVINLPSLNLSFAYDCQTSEWAQWGSQQPFQSEPGLLMAGCSTGQGSTLFAGSATDSRVFLWDTSNKTDDGTDIDKLVTAVFWTTAGKLRLNNLGLACVRGVGDALSPDPQVRMRMSKDGGRTFGSWVYRSLGAVGEYTRKAVWRALGLVSQPGVLVEFSTTEPVIFAAEGVSMNESRY